jgi:ABC-2 type transport system permease protein
MRLFRILTFKELKGYFLTPFGWVVLAFVTIMQGVSLSTASATRRCATAWFT